MNPRSTFGQEAKIVRREDSSAWLEGNAYLEKAKKRLEEAQREASKIKEQAWQQGYREGRLAGMQEIQLLISEAQDSVKSFQRNLERQAADLALAIARKAVGSVDISDAIVNGAAEALASFKPDSDVALIVPAALQDKIRAKMAQIRLAAGDGGPRQVDVRSDAGLRGFQAFLVDESASVDLSMPAQLEAVENSLRMEIAGGEK